MNVHVAQISASNTRSPETFDGCDPLGDQPLGDVIDKLAVLSDPCPGDGSEFLGLERQKSRFIQIVT